MNNNDNKNNDEVRPEDFVLAGKNSGSSESIIGLFDADNYATTDEEKY
jgi:hypothetical protein